MMNNASVLGENIGPGRNDINRLKREILIVSNTTVITYGSFDMFHVGHLKLLQRLKILGDKVIVAVSTDEFNEIKGKTTLIPYDQRAEIVANIKCVDKVIPEKSWEQKIEDVMKYNVDIFAIGNDWEGMFDFLKDYCEVVYLERTKEVSTTKLKKSLGDISAIPESGILNAFDVIEQLRSNFD